MPDIAGNPYWMPSIPKDEDDNFHTDLFTPLIADVERLRGELWRFILADKKMEERGATMEQRQAMWDAVGLRMPAGESAPSRTNREQEEKIAKLEARRVFNETVRDMNAQARAAAKAGKKTKK